MKQLIRYNYPLSAISSDEFFLSMDRLFDAMMHTSFPDLPEDFSCTEGSYPRYDALEYKDRFSIEMEIPGIKKENIKIQLNENALTILCDKREENYHKSNGEKPTIHANQIKRSKLKKTMFIHPDADLNKISAEFSDGMLYITIPKKVPNEPPPSTIKEIPIK